MIEVNQKLVSAYIRQGHHADAATAFDAVMTSFKRHVESGSDEAFTRYYVACAAAMMGKHDEALEHLGHALKSHRAFMLARARVEQDFEDLRSATGFSELVGTV